MSEEMDQRVRAWLRVIDDYFGDESHFVHRIRYDHYIALVTTEHNVENPESWVVFTARPGRGYLVPDWEFERYKARMSLVFLVTMAAIILVPLVLFWTAGFWKSTGEVALDIILFCVGYFAFSMGIFFAMTRILTRPLQRQFSQSYYAIEFPEALKDVLAEISRKVARRQRWVSGVGMGAGFLGGQILGPLIGKIGEKAAEKAVEYAVHEIGERHVDKYAAKTIDAAISSSEAPKSP